MVSDFADTVDMVHSLPFCLAVWSWLGINAHVTRDDDKYPRLTPRIKGIICGFARHSNDVQNVLRHDTELNGSGLLTLPLWLIDNCYAYLQTQRTPSQSLDTCRPG